MGNERWRVVAPLRAVNDQKGIVEISRGAVLEAIASPGDVGFVRVQWNTQELLVFVQDLADRSVRTRGSLANTLC